MGKIRQQREKERLQREKEERAMREAEEEKRKLADEEKKKAAIANMSQHYGGYLARTDRNKNNRRQTEREKKRKILAERRKALNIDHLNNEKLKDKAGELQKLLTVLEEEKFDFETKIEKQKYEINQMRQRVSDYMGRSGKNKGSSRKQVKTLTSVAAKTKAFK